MNTDLLIKTRVIHSLNTFVAELQQVIGFTTWEERQSSNYLEEHYFRCMILEIEIAVALADDAEFKDFEFWISFQSNFMCCNEIKFLSELTDFIARKLVLNGCKVIRPYNMGKMGSGGLTYW